jgi:hypothetical protein
MYLIDMKHGLRYESKPSVSHTRTSGGSRVPFNLREVRNLVSI